MAINKVVYGNNTLIDLTNDTVEASNLLEGETAHDRSGTPVTGTAKQGHAIKDGDGSVMPTQPNLQFADANVSNDGTGGATVVRNFVDIDWDDWQKVDDNDDTYYRVKDAPLVDGNVEIDLMKKLWENPAPTASFNAQNITLANDDYNSLLWLFMTGVTFTIVTQLNVICLKGESTAFVYSATTNGTSTSASIRSASRNSDTSYSIGDCYTQNSGSNRTVNNNLCVPIAVYGIKQKVTISLSAIISNVSTSASKCMLSDGETSVEEAIADNNKWNLVGSIANVPNTAYEVMIVIQTSFNSIGTVIIPYAEIPCILNPLMCFYNNASSWGYCQINISSATTMTIASIGNTATYSIKSIYYR